MITPNTRQKAVRKYYIMRTSILANLKLRNGGIFLAKAKNTIKLMDSYLNQANANYTLYPNNIIDIYEASKTPCELIYNSFRFGYMQGMKAARAELRKGCK